MMTLPPPDDSREPPVEAIPFFVPDLGQDEIDEVVRTLRSGWLTTGPQVAAFEAEFAAAVGAQHAVAVNSATAALHLALEAAGVGAGDEVLVPTMTFAATAEVVIHLGARPVLLDCAADSLHLDPEAARAAISPRSKAIIPVHYAGEPCKMDALVPLAERHGLALIEDAAHAFPAAYGGRSIGGIGAATCFSFYANKTITTGEGGMLTTNDAELADRARLMSLHGLSRDAWRRYAGGGSWAYEIVRPGFKYNLTDIAAALGRVQLRRAESFRRARRQVAGWYGEALGNMQEIRLPSEPEGSEHAWHLYVVQLESARTELDRPRLIERLAEAKIATSVHWIPLHLHSYYRDQFGYRPEDFPRATAAFERIVSLPLFPGMTRRQVNRVANTIREALT